MSDVDARLRALLAGDPPASVTALDEAHRAALADLLTTSRKRQADSLEAAFADTLKYVPFPLRKLVRKVLL